MTSNLWLLHWLLSARAFLAVDGGEGIDAARELIEDREFWVLGDPEQPALTYREARARRAIGYRVMIEVGLESELPNWVRTVDAVLDDARGWKSAGRELVRVRGGERFTVLLARPRTVDRLCSPLRTRGEYSCGREGRAALNLTRWREGAQTWGDEVRDYRVYMINHEIGHLLGMPHSPCEEADAPADVMLQQTMSLDGCQPRSWPSTGELQRLLTRRARRGFL